MIYLVYGMTESGDDWRLAFKSRPTEKEIIYEIGCDPWLYGEYKAECILGWDIVGVDVIDNT